MRLQRTGKRSGLRLRPTLGANPRRRTRNFYPFYTAQHSIFFSGILARFPHGGSKWKPGDVLSERPSKTGRTHPCGGTAATLGSGRRLTTSLGAAVLKEIFGRQIPEQVGVAAATVVMVGVVVGFAQIPTGVRTGEGGVAPIGPPSSFSAPGGTSSSTDATAPVAADPTATAPGASVHGQATPGAAPTDPSPGPNPATAGPAPTTATPGPGKAPEPSTEPGPGKAPAPGSQPPDAGPDAQTVQRVTDSCSRRLQSDAVNSGVVTGPVVPRPYTLVSVAFVGAPQRSSAGPGLESYDVTTTVSTRPVDGPVQTDQRVCRVYDYDSHVDWLPLG